MRTDLLSVDQLQFWWSRGLLYDLMTDILREKLVPLFKFHSRFVRGEPFATLRTGLSNARLSATKAMNGTHLNF